jgi:hypothetical protein
VRGAFFIDSLSDPVAATPASPPLFDRSNAGDAGVAATKIITYDYRSDLLLAPAIGVVIDAVRGIISGKFRAMEFA